ncbi:MAG: ATP-dependent DNA helicase [Janthinobacterium lividum]
MAWSLQQEAALRAVRQWQSDPSAPQVFRLFGFAGTGKTTLAKTIAGDTPGQVEFGAFTGKAASVLRQKGCEGARTLHSLIYKLHDDIEGEPVFGLDHASELAGAALLILDECSMVGADLGRDVLSFGVRVLVLGDPGQLPPIEGVGFFDGEPDVMLTEVHRQAAESPIIVMATKVREGGRLVPGRYGDCEVVAPGVTLDADRVLASDQMLVGRNATRRSYNRRTRELRGFTGAAPVAGEKLVCLKNNRTKGLLNGGLWAVDKVLGHTGKGITLRVTPEGEGSAVKVRVPMPFFLGTEDTMDWKAKKHADQFGFGYALTVHKSQGSQWDDVVLFDESSYFREHRARHLYTGLTRAAQKITVVQ